MSEIYKKLALSEIKASTHRTHPDTSREAAERVQPHVGAQAVAVLRAVSQYPGCTAKQIDLIKQTNGFPNWNQWAQRRLVELKEFGYIKRYKNTRYDRELHNKITKAGIEYLENLSGSKKGQ